jgi:hypothetical protein
LVGERERERERVREIDFVTESGKKRRERALEARE